MLNLSFNSEGREFVSNGRGQFAKMFLGSPTNVGDSGNNNQGGVQKNKYMKKRFFFQI